MKKITPIVTIALSITFLLGTTSCAVFVKGDSGKHKGWNKNTNNPHNPNTTNPGKGKGKK